MGLNNTVRGIQGLNKHGIKEPCHFTIFVDEIF